MALFWNAHEDRGTVLRPLHAFGRRASVCQTVLQAADVSQVHALVRWSGRDWQIVDQSRNGTTLNGERLPNGQWVALPPQAEISFGGTAEATWVARDLEAPVTCLFPRDGRGEAIALVQRENLLPDPVQPEANIHWREGRWLLEHIDGIEVLADGATVRTSTQAWEFVLCDDLDPTLEVAPISPSSPLAELVFHFDVSQNEEHTRLDLLIGERTLPLGERIHHYTLVTLARLREQDAQRGLAPQSQGWIALDELSRMLGVEPSYLNIQIFRAKHQVLDALPPNMADLALVERRRGDVRFGGHAFRISGGAGR